MKPINIQTTSFDRFAVINEKKIIFTHFFGMIVDFVSFLFNSGLGAVVIVDEILTSDFPDLNSEVKLIMEWLLQFRLVVRSKSNHLSQSEV